MSLKLKGAFVIFISSFILIPISGSTHGWKKFFDQITPIIQNYMDENSINILLDRKNVFIGKTDSDITNSIIEKINIELKK